MALALATEAGKHYLWVGKDTNIHQQFPCGRFSAVVYIYALKHWFLYTDAGKSCTVQNTSIFTTCISMLTVNVYSGEEYQYVEDVVKQYIDVFAYAQECGFIDSEAMWKRTASGSLQVCDGLHTTVAGATRLASSLFLDSAVWLGPISRSSMPRMDGLVVDIPLLVHHAELTFTCFVDTPRFVMVSRKAYQSAGDTFVMFIPDGLRLNRTRLQTMLRMWDGIGVTPITPIAEFLQKVDLFVTPRDPPEPTCWGYQQCGIQ